MLERRVYQALDISPILEPERFFIWRIMVTSDNIKDGDTHDK